MKAKAIAVDWNEDIMVRLSWLAAVSGFIIAYRLFVG